MKLYSHYNKNYIFRQNSVTLHNVKEEGNEEYEVLHRLAYAQTHDVEKLWGIFTVSVKLS